MAQARLLLAEAEHSPGQPVTALDFPLGQLGGLHVALWCDHDCSLLLLASSN
jgi:hypothetical protein